MRIIAQNKRMLVECNLVVIGKSFEDCYYIKAVDPGTFPEDKSKMNIILGRYSTLEKAMKVLAELQEDAIRLPQDDEVK